METRRYIVTYTTSAPDAPALLLTYWATFAASAEEAEELFEDARPDARAVRVEAADPARRFMYGEGWLTEEERAAATAALRASYDRQRDAQAQAEERLSEYSLAEFAARTEWEKRRAAGPSQNAEGVYIGDLFYAEWGYEQTNITYFQVVGLKGAHTAVLRRIGRKSEETEQMQGISRPVRDCFVDGNAYTVRTAYKYDRLYIKAPDAVCSGILRPCKEGEIHYWTAYA